MLGHSHPVPYAHGGGCGVGDAGGYASGGGEVD